ncbi:hypothetical protein J2X53_003453 [Pseudorhodobacter sp. 4114]|nr:hypothetical protein [Pseudorhodobacter sp. 4114]
MAAGICCLANTPARSALFFPDDRQIAGGRFGRRGRARVTDGGQGRSGQVLPVAGAGRARCSVVPSARAKDSRNRQRRGMLVCIGDHHHGCAKLKSPRYQGTGGGPRIALPCPRDIKDHGDRCGHPEHEGE